MKLLLFPLCFLIVFAVLSQSGIASFTAAHNNTAFSDATWTATEDGYFDSTGHQVMERDGMTRTDEFGHEWGTGSTQYWLNVTNAPDAADPDGVDGSSQDTSYPIAYLMNGTNADDYTGQTFNFVGTSLSYGMLAIVFAIIILAVVVGLRVFGSGVSDMSVSAIIKGTAFASIWIVFSLMAAPLIIIVPMGFGFIFYFFISALYTMGTINQMGSPGED